MTITLRSLPTPFPLQSLYLLITARASFHAQRSFDDIPLRYFVWKIDFLHADIDNFYKLGKYSLVQTRLYRVHSWCLTR